MLQEADRLRVTSAPSVREQVAEKLRQAIALGEFEPGARLVERVLCERIGVSRTSLREALRQLEHEGLVTNVPHRGLIIAKPDRKQAAAIFEARSVLEGLICRQFCERASKEQMSALKAALGALARAYETGVPREMLSAKTRFYEVLMEGADSEVAEQMLRSIHIRVSQLRVTSLSNPNRAQRSLQEIRTLVDAILAGDAAKSESLSRHHVEMAGKAALAMLDQQ
ncbi:MAG: GntR family transcriptional regulator [Azospirillaceae bacterium]